MNCPHCNTLVESDEEFCGNCGQPLKVTVWQEPSAPGYRPATWETEAAAPPSDSYLTNPTPVPAPSVAPLAPPAQRPSGSQRNRLIGLILVVVLLVSSGSGIGVYLLSHRASSGTGNIGQASFFSSGQINSKGASSFNDGIQVRIEHVSDPSAGNHYYAWLRDEQTETTSIYLGALTVNQGIASLAYTDPQHRDLLAIASNFLVTEETASVTPNNPSLDKGQWRYIASVPQIRSAQDNFSYLDHIRHLLSSDPDLNKLHLPGGIDFWFLNNMEQLQKAAIEAKDTTRLYTVRQKISNVLYYLDGPCAPLEVKNTAVPPTPEKSTIAHATAVGLLDCAEVPKPPGHLSHIGRHLNGIAQAPSTTTVQIRRAIEINSTINLIKAWLDKAHKDAKELAVMNDGQLSQAQALRNDLVIQVDNAVNGRIDPASQAVEPSVRQVGNTIEFLASFTVMPYKG